MNSPYLNKLSDKIIVLVVFIPLLSSCGGGSTDTASLTTQTPSPTTNNVVSLTIVDPVPTVNTSPVTSPDPVSQPDPVVATPTTPTPTPLTPPTAPSTQPDPVVVTPTTPATTPAPVTQPDPVITTPTVPTAPSTTPPSAPQPDPVVTTPTVPSTPATTPSPQPDPVVTTPTVPTTPTPTPVTSTKHILPLGDSITNGGNGFASYRRNLWFMLRNAGFDVDFIGSQTGFAGSVDNALKDFDLDHEGHWAWEAGDLDGQLSGWLNSYTPDIVLMHVGTNDFDRGQSNASTMNELESLINKLRAKNGNVIILLAKLIPMQNRDTASINQSIEALASSISTQSSPVVIVDQYSGYNPSSDNYDNYHPNRSGEQKMANQWFNALQAYL